MFQIFVYNLIVTFLITFPKESIKFVFCSCFLTDCSLVCEHTHTKSAIGMVDNLGVI